MTDQKEEIAADMVAIDTMLRAMEGMQAQSQQLTDLLIDLTKRVGMLERANKAKLVISNG